MKLVKENDIYILEGLTFADRELARKAGFKFSNTDKRWFTANWWVAMRAVESCLVDYQTAPHQIPIAIVNAAASYKQTSDGLKLSLLFPYQEAGVREIMRRPNILLADEQGLGKTLQVIEYLNRTLTLDTLKPQKVIIIAPASLKINWAREIEKWNRVPANVQILNTGKDRIAFVANILIVNYDLLKSKIISDQLLEFNADVLVCDEAHYLKNSKAARTKSVGALAAKIKKKIFLTGTPMLNRPIELHSILKMISPETMHPFVDYRSYARRFCAAYEGVWGMDVSGASHVEELHDRLRATCMVRRLKKDVMDQMPDKLIQIVPFENDKKTGKLIEKEYFVDVESIKKSPHRGTMGDIAEVRHALALAKIEESVAFIEGMLEEGVEKVVVFAHHHDVINLLEIGLMKFTPTVLTGRMSQPVRQKAVDDFQNKPECRVFIGQMQAAGTGLTLTAANHVVFVEHSWVPGEIHQAIDRCHRIGQKSNVTAKFLVVEDSLDETMLRTIFDKEKIINKILD